MQQLELEATGLLRILAAVALAVPLGWDRERHQRPAGLRTHMLVAAASASFVSTAMLLVPEDAAAGVVDPVRALQAVASGISFLGAGTIFGSRDRVSGLTTAASLLVTSAVGVTAGAGCYLLAAGLTALAMMVLVVVRWIEPAVGSAKPK